MSAPAAAEVIQSAARELRQLLGSRASDAASVREHHSHGESYHLPAPPDIVCFPATTDEVAAIVKIAAAHRLAVVPFGAGTSLEGHVNAIHGGVTIDLREMNAITRVSVDDLDVTVEAGVTRLQLNKALNNTGLTFPVDPGADATIGGMTATRASGTTAVRYGTMRENVLGLTVVLADGTVIHTGTRARKSSAGYDLTRLFVGSEGTLGVITEITLRLHPLPEAVQALAAERGGRGFQWATHPEDRARLWQARHDALYAALALRPGSRGWTTDVCVPISRLAECVVETKKENAGASFPICLVGHAGDGNFHLIYALDPSSAAELEEARRLNERMVLRALEMGGTCSGEHGVGVGKMKFLEREHGAALGVMRTIKRALDPDNRMNPGKMLSTVE